MHLSCYRCSHCQRSLAGEFYYRRKVDGEKRVFCERCFFRLAPICFFCLKTIDDISLHFGEKIFHPLCFRCDRCEQPFRGAEVFPLENKKFCSTCFAEIQKDFLPISSSIFAERCATCRKTFQPADLIVQHRFNETNLVFHASCFRCDLCRRNLSNAFYFSPNEPKETSLTLRCEPCHRTSAESICSTCFQPADSPMILYNDRWFHDDWYEEQTVEREHGSGRFFSFVCKKCHYHLKNLSRMIVEVDGLLCERCHRAKAD